MDIKNLTREKTHLLQLETQAFHNEAVTTDVISYKLREHVAKPYFSEQTMLPLTLH